MVQEKEVKALGLKELEAIFETVKPHCYGIKGLHFR